MFRDAAGALVLLIADPFDARLRAWADELAGEHFEARLAPRVDLAAWLARHGEALRAVAGMVPRLALIPIWRCRRGM